MLFQTHMTFIPPQKEILEIFLYYMENKDYKESHMTLECHEE